MAESIIAHPAHESTTEPAPGYVLRGLGLFELHREEILAGYEGAGRWLIPSGSESGKLYEVRVGTVEDRHRCECIGFVHHRHCSHVEAARRAAKLSAVCDACGTRVWWSELRQVEEDDELLSWYPGDVLCGACIAAGFWA